MSGAEIGLRSFADPETQRNPFPFVAKLLAGDRVYHDPVTQMPLVVRYDDIAAIFANPKLFSSRNPLIFERSVSPVFDELSRRFRERGFAHVDTLVTNDPPSHGRFRALVDKVFTPSVVRKLEERMTAIADDLIAALPADGPADLVPTFAMKLPLLFITEQLGVPQSDWPRIKHWSDIAIERIAPPLPAARELAIADDLIEMQNYIWARAQEAPAETLIGLLLRAEIDGDRLKPAELINIATQFFVAGHETTTALIGHATLMLLDDPDLRGQIAADRALLTPFVEEALRLHPPVAALRIATEDCMVADVAIPRGALVTLCTMTGNYDAAAFPDPTRVDLTRRNGRQHLSLGRGIHYCLGNLVARAEARIALDRLFTRLPGLQLDPAKPRPHYAALYHSHTLQGLDVVY